MFARGRPCNVPTGRVWRESRCVFTPSSRAVRATGARNLRLKRVSNRSRTFHATGHDYPVFWGLTASRRRDRCLFQGSMSPQHATYLRSLFLARLHERETQAQSITSQLATNATSVEIAQHAAQERLTFITSLGHSLRTPLNIIRGYTQLLEAGVRGALNPGQQHDVRRIEANERQLLSVVDSVISFARWDTGVSPALEGISVRAAVRVTDAVMRRASSAKGVMYDPRNNVLPADLVVRAESSRLREILLQLILNAVKFSRRNDSVFVHALAAGERVWIQVTDTGIGISEEDLQEIFKPFVRARDAYVQTQEGIGLGLAIAQALAHSMEGEISVVSEVGVGSTFTLALPCGRGPRPVQMVST